MNDTNTVVTGVVIAMIAIAIATITSIVAMIVVTGRRSITGWKILKHACMWISAFTFVIQPDVFILSGLVLIVSKMGYAKYV
jgi:hypothetical protein